MKPILQAYDQWREWIIHHTARLLFKKFKPTVSYNKILVVRKGTIGDHLVCQPIYAYLKAQFSASTLDLLTSNGNNNYAHIQYLPEHIFFNQTYNFEDFERRNLLKVLQQNKYDLVIELPQDLDTIYTQIRNMLVYKYWGISSGIGWHAGISFLAKRYRFYHVELPREFVKLSNALRKYGMEDEIKEVYLPAKETELPPELARRNLKDMIILAPGAKFKSKEWPYFNLLAHELKAKGYELALIGSANDGQNIAVNCINLCGKLSIEQSRFLLSKVALLICNDSGPMHLGYAVNTPLIALFGGRNYAKSWWPPQSDKFKVLFQPDQKCEVAYIGNDAKDKEIDPHLASISVEQVLDAVQTQIISNH